MSVAQKLCDKICEARSSVTPRKQSIRGSYKVSSQAFNSEYDGRPTRSIVIEKQKVINKVVPRGHISKTKIINEFKGKETVLKKKYIDTGLNTIITGPLTCDNYCVTMVRKRDLKGCCNCAHKGLKMKSGVKEVQTFEMKNYSLLDKACEQIVETMNSGTQFFERFRNRSKVKLGSEVSTQITGSTKKDQNFRDGKSEKHDDCCNNVDHFMGARRWALSHYPIRGPDF